MSFSWLLHFKVPAQGASSAWRCSSRPVTRGRHSTLACCTCPWGLSRSPALQSALGWPGRPDGALGSRGIGTLRGADSSLITAAGSQSMSRSWGCGAGSPPPRGRAVLRAPQEHGSPTFGSCLGPRGPSPADSVPEERRVDQVDPAQRGARRTPETAL